MCLFYCEFMLMENCLTFNRVLKPSQTVKIRYRCKKLMLPLWQISFSSHSVTLIGSKILIKERRDNYLRLVLLVFAKRIINCSLLCYGLTAGRLWRRRLLTLQGLPLVLHFILALQPESTALCTKLRYLYLIISIVLFTPLHFSDSFIQANYCFLHYSRSSQPVVT